MEKPTIKTLYLLIWDHPEWVMAAAIREGVTLIGMDIAEDDAGGYLALRVDDSGLAGTREVVWVIQETPVRVRMVHVPLEKRFRGLAQ